MSEVANRESQGGRRLTWDECSIEEQLERLRGLLKRAHVRQAKQGRKLKELCQHSHLGDKLVVELPLGHLDSDNDKPFELE